MWSRGAVKPPASALPSIPTCCCHACGYRLANEGKDAFAIQGWLGHQSLSMTKGYCALAIACGQDSSNPGGLPSAGARALKLGSWISLGHGSPSARLAPRFLSQRCAICEPVSAEAVT
jgi:hypothetical protein